MVGWWVGRPAILSVNPGLQITKLFLALVTPTFAREDYLGGLVVLVRDTTDRLAIQEVMSSG